jgi:hypothetical protein
VNIGLAADPEAVTDSPVGTALTGTFQVPRFCHPLVNPLVASAYRYMFLAPAKDSLKLSDTVTVRLFPLPDALEGLPLIAHWLFSNAPADLAANGPCHAVPASLTK